MCPYTASRVPRKEPVPPFLALLPGILGSDRDRQTVAVARASTVLSADEWVRGTLGLFDNPWAVALLGAFISTGYGPGWHTMLLLNPSTSGAHHTWPGDQGLGGGRCHIPWRPPSLPPSGSFKVGTPRSSIPSPALLFVPPSSFWEAVPHAPSWSPLPKSPTSSPADHMLALPYQDMPAPWIPHSSPKLLLRIVPGPSKEPPSRRPGPSAGWCQDRLAPSPFCTALKPLLPPLKALPSKPYHGRGRSEYSVSLLGLRPACSLLPDSTQLGSTSGPGLYSGAQEAGHSPDW